MLVLIDAHPCLLSLLVVGRLAEKQKEIGNQLYKTKKYKQAIPFYTEAIKLCPDSPSYFGNRSACYMMLRQYKEALQDAKKSVLLDPRFVKGYIRIAKCSLALGEINAAENAISSVKEMELANTAVLPEIKKIENVRRCEENARQAYLRNDYIKVVYYLDGILKNVPCSDYKLWRVECLALMGRYQEAQKYANATLHFDKQNTDAMYIIGICLYHQGNLDKAFSHFKHVLKLAPDHTKTKDIYKKAKLLKQKKEGGNLAFKSNKLAAAYTLYTEALRIDPYNNSINAKLYFNRATVHSKRGQLDESVADCTAALSLDPNYLKALLRRARSYMELGEYEDAVHDYENVCKMDNCRENRRLLEEAKLALSKPKYKDYYKVLGLDKKASPHEIKKAYHKKVLMHHPDRHPTASTREIKKQERIFKEVREAYEILTGLKPESKK